MPGLATDTDSRYCRCGALCEGTKSRCRKCRDRARWYRRKAWHCKFPPTPDPNSGWKK